ncbi:hypothetical protein Dole_1702 [Desulfosudis oleivorans Hxd3]|uniref:Tetratricopeptide repeat protein n=1 Tax=Desulfosudis oleivorans (strain DSM 6200 / JCM 39069 / Hxd3) TaxID=96561 RepID=A9A0K6_DESOH|nr:hypothetical protein Dole_1702 [Desulfosudis oleivorans Hxd3]
MICLLIDQVIIYRLFWGDRQGDFEYKYREVILEKRISRVIIQKYGVFKYFQYYIDQFNQIGYSQKTICLNLLKDEKISQDYAKKFIILLKTSDLFVKDGDNTSAIQYLKHAINIKPTDLVANYRLAVLYESIGDREKAIEHYLKGMRDSLINSDRLRRYIKSQIKRVETKGPMKKPPMLGLRYMSW